jgi:hypothetical protein
MRRPFGDVSTGKGHPVVRIRARSEPPRVTALNPLDSAATAHLTGRDCDTRVRKMTGVAYPDAPPDCIIAGWNEPRYHGAERCHRHHRERMLSLPSSVVPSS